MPSFKQVVSRIAVLVLFSVGVVVCGETGVTPPSGVYIGAPPLPTPPPSVFDLESKNPPPATSKGSIEGAERYYGDSPNYNTEQRAKWLEICEPKKSVDFEAYRECYQNEKKKSAEALREKLEATERGQSQPLRNVGNQE
jgi:hypothetical protein